MKKDLSDVAFPAVSGAYAVILGGVIPGLLWYFAGFVLELGKHSWVALPVGTAVLLFDALELLAMQKPFQ